MTTHRYLVPALLCCALAAPGARATTLPDGFEETLVVGGLDTPTAMAFAPDGRLFVAEKGGRVRIVRDGALLPAPFLTVAVSTGLENGLGGVVLDPDFAANRHLYVYYSAPSPTQVNRVSRFRAGAADPDAVEAGSELVLVDGIPAGTGFHNGGFLHFGADGLLYVGVGDTAAPTLVQDLGSLVGKVLRIDPAGHPDVVPADNPFVDTPGARGEIWAYGFRNPFTAAFRPGTSLLYVNDVGNTSFEEINDVRAGLNYGWPAAEGFSANPAFTNPIHAYAHDGRGAAITGGVFYEAEQFPSAYRGRYFFADYVRQFIRTLDPADASVADFVTDSAPVLDLDVGPDGALYALVKSDGTYSFSDSEVRRIAFVGDANRAPVAVASAEPTSGPLPLVVDFSAAGSSDPDGDPLTYLWDFGDDSPAAEGETVVHTYTRLGSFAATVTVSDDRGGATTSDPIVITTDNSPPAGTITAPADGSLYRGGETIAFAGLATDPDEGALAAGAFSWVVVLHHNTHTHPFLGPIAGVDGGTFEIPVVGETDADQWYRVHLVVTDGGGLTHASFADILPRTSTLSFETNVPGLGLELDGQPIVPPLSLLGVAGMVRTLGAPPVQIAGDTTYELVAWSDGGAPEHEIVTPDEDTAYVAHYEAVSVGAALATRSGGLRVSWRDHRRARARDRFSLAGVLDPGALPLGDTAGREMVVALNGVEVARGRLGRGGRYATRAPGTTVLLRLSGRTGRFRVALGRSDLRDALGVTDTSEARDLPVAVTLGLEGPPARVAGAEIVFGYTARAGVRGVGRLRPPGKLTLARTSRP